MKLEKSQKLIKKYWKPIKIQEKDNELQIEHFTLSDLVVNITEHELVPKHILLTKKDLNKLNADSEKVKSHVECIGSISDLNIWAMIAYNKESGEVRSGQIPAPAGFDYYLIKLGGVSAEAGFRKTENFGRLEYSFYQLARKCGIEMSDCSLIEENGRAHFLTKRFDRENGRKIHMQTLCGIAHYDFRLQRAYSYEQAFTIMRRLRLPYSQAEQMFLRMVFNVIIRNQDDHTKNISFLMNSTGHWRLSPAYDIGFAYNPDGNWTNTHQMSINNKFSNISKADLLSCAEFCNIRNAKEIIDNVCSNVSEWPVIARNCGVPRKMIDARFPHMLLKL